MKKYLACLCMTAALSAASCADDNGGKGNPAPGPEELAEEYYAGGKLGTAFNTTSAAFEQPTPVVDGDGEMARRFLNGEQLFEKPFVTNPTGVRGGLGPLYVRNSCIACHPGYGHGQRQEGIFNASKIGNGYLLVVYDDKDKYIASLTGMPQHFAVEPFTAPVDPSQISIAWKSYTDEWGNKFDDGESYELIYPEVSIPQSAYYVDLVTTDGRTLTADQVNVRLESTIGIYGTGLLDAIDDDDLKAEYAKQEADGYFELNEAFFKGGEWTARYSNSRPNDGGTGEQHPYRFTYALSRGPLQDAAGANAFWNITNVTRPNRRYHYMTNAYVEKALTDQKVRDGFRSHIAAYCPDFEQTGDLDADIRRYLTGLDAAGRAILPTEVSDDDYIDLMVWHRGLAVPAARNLDDEAALRGKTLFTEIGCAYCHRPSWTTGDDILTDPSGFFADGDSRLPRYPHQKIWPYSDLVQHRLHMENDIRTGWCRTTPLWGRGLHQKCTGASEADRLHDCRARTTIEAIMWHGNAQSDARRSIDRFRKLNKSDRDAIVRFIESI